MQYSTAMLDSGVRINEARFWRTVERSGAIGPGRPGGLSRLALSDADRMAMIFTPCREGITHNNNGRAEAGYTAPGVNVLLHAAARAEMV